MIRTRLSAALAALGCLASALHGAEIFSSAGLTVLSPLSAATEDSSTRFVEARIGLAHAEGPFSLLWDLSFDTEGRYPAPFLGNFMGDFSVDIEEAGLRYQDERFMLALGKLENRDIVDSPYSLFASGAGKKAMLAELRYEDGKIFFSDRWIGLNRNLKKSQNIYDSDDKDIYKDRGLVLKTYGIKLGKLRLGFQDASLFTGSYFDFDYFANPAPGFYIQYVGRAPGRPWSREGNQNAILGFFADYRGEAFYLYGQFLVDDFNMNRFLNPGDYQNPDKIALSAGGTWESPWGRIGLYAAGATKYTFESYGNESGDSYYSYTYYPASSVYYGSNHTDIPLEDLMVGYRHGENSLALLATWAGRLGIAGLGASAEFTLSGSKSPANPWHDLEDYNSEGAEGTLWLDGDTLERRILLSADASALLGPVELSVKAGLGYVWNKLALDYDVPDRLNGSEAIGSTQPIWRPSAESGLLGSFSIRGRVGLGF